MKTKNCKTCDHCKMIYRKSRYHFWRFSLRYCTALNQIIQSDGWCEEWKKKKYVCDISEERLLETEQALLWLRDNVKDV